MVTLLYRADSLIINTPCSNNDTEFTRKSQIRTTCQRSFELVVNYIGII